MKRFNIILLFGLLVVTSIKADEQLHHRPRYTLRAGDVLELPGTAVQSVTFGARLKDIVTAGNCP